MLEILKSSQPGRKKRTKDKERKGEGRNKKTKGAISLGNRRKVSGRPSSLVIYLRVDASETCGTRYRSNLGMTRNDKATQMYSLLYDRRRSRDGYIADTAYYVERRRIPRSCRAEVTLGRQRGISPIIVTGTTCNNMFQIKRPSFYSQGQFVWLRDTLGADRR